MSKVTFLFKVMKKVQLASSWNKHILHHNSCNRKAAWTRSSGRGKKTWSVTISLHMSYHMQKLFSTESDCYINMTAHIPYLIVPRYTLGSLKNCGPDLWRSQEIRLFSDSIKPGSEAQLVAYSRVPRLRICGVTPPLPNLPSWQTQL